MLTGQTSSEEQNHTVSRTYSEDSLNIDPIKNREYRDDKHNRLINNECGGSVILAGNLVNTEFISLPDLCQTTKENYNVAYNDKQLLLQDTLNNDNDTFYLSIKSDLNKCINLFHNKYLSKEHDIYGKYTSNSTTLSKMKNSGELNHERNTAKVQCDLIRTCSRAMSLNSLKHLALPKQEIRKCKSCTMIDSDLKRDANHNIKASRSFLTVKKPTLINSYKTVETVIPLFDALSLSQSSASSSKQIEKPDFQLNEENQRYVSTNSEKSIREELDPKELKSVLYSLKDPLKPLEEAVTQEYLLKRLSATFYNSPRNFTERLLTIIEESVIDNDSCTSAVNLSRLTTELRKMCKFIEDETIPEWPPSPSISSPICSLREKDQECSAELSKKISTNLILSRCGSLSTLSTPSKNISYSNISVSPRYNITNSEKIYRRIPKGISINTMKSPMYNSVMHDSTSTFECLEAHCKRIFSDESRISSGQKNILRPSLQNMSDILNMCENQMASLENSPNTYEQFKNKSITSIPSFESQYNAISEAPNFPVKSFLHKTQNKIKSKDISKTLKQYPGYKHHEIIQINDLENTIMYEIAKKRQRCLDTAKVMMEIDAKSKPSGKQETYYLNSLADNNTKLMQTLMSCKKYKDYLELLNLFQQAEPCNCPSPCNKKNVQVKNNIKKTDIAACEITKLPTAKKKDLNPSTKCLSAPKKTAVSKPRLFVTPGKTPNNKNNTKKRIYFPDLTTSSTKQITESNISPHAKSIYRHMGLNYDTVISPVGMYIKGTNPQLIKNVRLKTNKMSLKRARKEHVKQNLNQKPEIKPQLSPKKCKEVNSN